MKDLKPQLVILITILALGAGFGGGYFFKNSQVSRMRQNLPGQFQGRTGTMPNGNGVQGQARFGTGATQGEIISQGDKSITVKLTDGSSKIIILSDTTTYSEEKTADKNLLKIGVKVGIFGTPNSDGSITAQNVQISPIMRGLPSPSSN